MTPRRTDPCLAMLSLTMALTACARSGAPDAGPDSHRVTGDAAPAESSTGCSGPLTISGPFAGDLYLDGLHTGLRAPVAVPRWSGVRKVAIGDGKQGYVRASATAGTRCTLELSSQDLVGPRVWRARYLTLRQVTANVSGATCTATLDDADADRTFESFSRSLTGQLEPASAGAMRWELTRREVTTPVVIRDLGWAYAVEATDVADFIADVVPGTLDLIVVFYRSAGAGCVIPGEFFGATTGPSPASREAGFVVVKLEQVGAVDPVWTYLEQNDPGVWIHEWLHTVADDYYPKLGAPLPPPGADGTVVHAAEQYGYSAPWMSWYADLIAGRIRVDGGCRGITPDWLLACTLADRVKVASCQTR